MSDSQMSDSQMLTALKAVKALIDKHGIGDNDRESEPVVEQVRAAIEAAEKPPKWKLGSEPGILFLSGTNFSVHYDPIMANWEIREGTRRGDRYATAYQAEANAESLAKIFARYGLGPRED